MHIVKLKTLYFPIHLINPPKHCLFTHYLSFINQPDSKNRAYFQSIYYKHCHYVLVHVRFLLQIYFNFLILNKMIFFQFFESLESVSTFCSHSCYIGEVYRKWMQNFYNFAIITYQVESNYSIRTSFHTCLNSKCVSIYSCAGISQFTDTCLHLLVKLIRLMKNGYTKN